MTDIEYATAMARVKTLAAVWFPCLGLEYSWDITFCFFRDSGSYLEKHGGAQAHPRGHTYVAETSVSWAYLSAVISLNLAAFADLADEEEQERVIVHEACHILVHEMRAATRCNCEEYDMRHEERVCTILAAAFLRSKTYWKDKEESRDDAN